jgi:hypothetical protein
MLRAGRIMHRVMCRFTENQTVMGWDRWVQVLGDEKRAVEQKAADEERTSAVMQQCLLRVEHRITQQLRADRLSLVENRAAPSGFTINEEHFTVSTALSDFTTPSSSRKGPCEGQPPPTQTPDTDAKHFSMDQGQRL